ncbi:MAG: radical SAM family heme chaperone HemW [Planctomycetes bacterium]|nr:radical SAM family heme chaperone HemW [Planctomycetota bacterium]
MKSPPSNPSVTQITSRGAHLQAKSGPITAADLALTPQDPPRGAYIHVPFCFHKCHYCDFYSIVDARDRQGGFVDRLLDEAEAARAWVTRPLETIFVGGGTPTLLPPALWEHLGRGLADRWPRGADCEFTVEANPETVTTELAAVLAAAGVNRVSIGAQSFDRDLLVALERHHEPANVARSVERMRAAGVEDVNLDLIFGIPGQTLESWCSDLDAALALEPSHLSCYGLMYEPNTALTQRLRAGTVRRIDPDLEADLYEMTVDRLGAAGYEHYEISNWARPGRRCRHNLLYWMNEPWWPAGPSAAGHVDGYRWKNVPRLADYLDNGPLPPITDVERLDDDGRIGEELMLGMRLVEGMTRERLDDLLERGTRGAERAEALARAADDGLVAERAGRVHLTRRGLLLADIVVGALL